MHNCHYTTAMSMAILPANVLTWQVFREDVIRMYHEGLLTEHEFNDVLARFQSTLKEIKKHAASRVVQP